MTDATICESAPLFKLCNTCGESKPATTEFFAPKKQYQYGLHCYCRACQRLEEFTAFEQNAHFSSKLGATQFLKS